MGGIFCQNKHLFMLPLDCSTRCFLLGMSLWKICRFFKTFPCRWKTICHMYGWTRTAMIPFYIQVTQLIKHLSVGRQHALSENVGGLLRKWNGMNMIQANVKLLQMNHRLRLLLFNHRWRLLWSHYLFALTTDLYLVYGWGCVPTGTGALLSCKFHQTGWLWNFVVFFKKTMVSDLW